MEEPLLSGHVSIVVQPCDNNRPRQDSVIGRAATLAAGAVHRGFSFLHASTAGGSRRLERAQSVDLAPQLGSGTLPLPPTARRKRHSALEAAEVRERVQRMLEDDLTQFALPYKVSTADTLPPTASEALSQLTHASLSANGGGDGGDHQLDREGKEDDWSVQSNVSPVRGATAEFDFEIMENEDIEKGRNWLYSIAVLLTGSLAAFLLVFILSHIIL